MGAWRIRTVGWKGPPSTLENGEERAQRRENGDERPLPSGPVSVGGSEIGGREIGGNARGSAPNDPQGPGGGAPPRPEQPGRESEGELATRTRRKVERPPRYKVILHNDDYTPMEFVVSILEQIFGKGPSEATQIMLQIHRSGMGVAGVYLLEIAETKVSTVHRLAEERGYPLRAGVEKE